MGSYNYIIGRESSLCDTNGYTYNWGKQLNMMMFGCV